MRTCVPSYQIQAQDIYDATSNDSNMKIFQEGKHLVVHDFS